MERGGWGELVDLGQSTEGDSLTHVCIKGSERRELGLWWSLPSGELSSQAKPKDTKRGKELL